MSSFMMVIKKIASALSLLLFLGSLNTSAQNLTLRPGDPISILGSGLAEGLQRDGWLEALFQGQFPEHQLSFRNLGFAGDELSIRMRCENFGTPDDWLTRTKASVIFAFFGYNESFSGAAGLE